METQKVAKREFRDKFATYLLASESPVAITCHGDTVGYFIHALRKRSDLDKDALREAATRWQEILDAGGIAEDEAVADFKELRAKQKRRWIKRVSYSTLTVFFGLFSGGGRALCSKTYEESISFYAPDV